MCEETWKRSLCVTGMVGILAVSLIGTLRAENAVAAAARAGNKEAIRSLIKQHSDVNLAEADGTTALHWAIRADDLAMSDLLIRAGANVKAANRYGVTPLWLAATNGNAQSVDLLLKAGADPNATLLKGETVLMAASRTGNPKVVKALLSHGANANAKEQVRGETALLRAAAENHAEAIELLVEFGADKNIRSMIETSAPFVWETDGMLSSILPRGGWTPLMFAARQNATQAARALIKAGSDVNLTDPDGTTALVLAIYNAHFDLAELLLENGADPNIADRTGMAALYAAVEMHTLPPTDYRPPPKIEGNLDALDLVKVLLAHRANPNARLKAPVIGRYLDRGDRSLGEGSTPFMRAAKTNDMVVMGVLLDGGANPLITQKDGTTPLMIAAYGPKRPGAYGGPYLGLTESGAMEAIKLCLQRGEDINAFNNQGQTALHLAADRGADSLVKFLVENGAKLDAKDRLGRTPLDVAKGVGVLAVRYEVPGHPSTAKALRLLMGETVEDTAKDSAPGVPTGAE